MTLIQLCNYAIYNFALRENNLIVIWEDFLLKKRI